MRKIFVCAGSADLRVARILPLREKPYALHSLAFETTTDATTAFTLRLRTGDLTGGSKVWESHFFRDGPDSSSSNVVTFARGGNPDRSWAAYPLGLSGPNGIGWLPSECVIIPETSLALFSADETACGWITLDIDDEI